MLQQAPSNLSHEFDVEAQGRFCSIRRKEGIRIVYFAFTHRLLLPTGVSTFESRLIIICQMLVTLLYAFFPLLYAPIGTGVGCKNSGVIFVNNITVGGICGDIRRYHPSNSYVLRSRGRGCGSSEAGRPSTESHADERHRCREWTLRGSGEPRVEYFHETIQNWWKKQAFNVKSEQVML